MSEFKFVQWGKGVPNDYQRLNAMMLNDQYLKDKLDPSPRGVLAWKKTSSSTIVSVGTTSSFNGIGTVDFDVEENRMIKISLFVYNIQSSISGSDPNTANILFSIDGGAASTDDNSAFQRVYYDSKMVTGNSANSMMAVYFTDTPLSKGSHNVQPQISCGTYIVGATITAVPTIRLVIEDIGAHVSQSS